MNKLFIRRVAFPAAGFVAPCRIISGLSVKKQVEDLFHASLRATIDGKVEPLVSVCDANSGDYQCNNALSLWPRIKGKGTQFGSSLSIGQAIAQNLPPSEKIDSCSVTGPGFVNIALSNDWIARSIQGMLTSGIGVWAPKLSYKRAIVDFSSPNIAKEMHVGHIRSTIIGDTIARLLEFSNVQVLRRNHVGDWGTQFGMLIEFLFDKFPDWEDATKSTIGDLQAFYRASKNRFDKDPVFKERAQKAVVKLQGGDPEYRKAWAHICEISRREYSKVYKRLGVCLEEKAESFYNPYIHMLLENLSNMGLVEESEGARVIFFEGSTVPLIVEKSDGGHNYASTDIAALWYRLNEEKAELILYVIGDEQSNHLKRVFKTAERAGWLPTESTLYPRAVHVKFGSVTDEHGKKLNTRSSTGLVRLMDLLDEAKTRNTTALVKHLKDSGRIEDWTVDDIKRTAEAVGVACVKYADLKNNRTGTYQFHFDQMLQDKGNTAVYLLYAYARICSIIRKSGRDIEELKRNAKISLDHPNERILAIQLLRFSEKVEEACKNFLPNVLCEYLYNLTEDFSKFYFNCPVIDKAKEPKGDPHVHVHEHRLLLCKATAVVMEQCFHLLGITPVQKL